jgi:integrase/recombinase XerD
VLEKYYVRPQAVDRIRASWIGSEIECYVVWLAERSYSPASVRCRVPVLFAFGEFAWAGGARSVGDLPAHVDAFVTERVPADRVAELSTVAGRERVKNVRGPIEQMLCLVVPGFTGSRRPLLDVPFIDELPGFFEYLRCERGLRPTSLHGYECYLRSFERYLRRVGVTRVVELSPALISAFVAERSRAGLAMASVGLLCGALRGFLRYAYRQGVLAGDLSKTGGSAADLPALRHPALDLAGGGEPGARLRGPQLDPRQAGLCRPAAARDLRPSQPRDRGFDA